MDVCYLAFTVTICVSMAVVVRTTEDVCQGNLAISGMILFSLVSMFWCAYCNPFRDCNGFVCD